MSGDFGRNILEILDNFQKEILVRFGAWKGSGHFYLTGGTALAEFYLRHRKSADLDFFTSEEELIAPFSYRVQEQLDFMRADVQRRRGSESFVELLVRRGEETTLIHLARDTPFRLEETREFPGYPRLKVDSLADLAGNKLLALFGRALLRDFIDVYCLVKMGKFGEEDLVEKAAVKDPGFDLYWLGVAFERIKTFKPDALDILLLAQPLLFTDLLEFFNRWRDIIADKLSH